MKKEVCLVLCGLAVAACSSREEPKTPEMHTQQPTETWSMPGTDTERSPTYQTPSSAPGSLDMQRDPASSDGTGDESFIVPDDPAGDTTLGVEGDLDVQGGVGTDGTGTTPNAGGTTSPGAGGTTTPGAGGTTPGGGGTDEPYPGNQRRPGQTPGTNPGTNPGGTNPGGSAPGGGGTTPGGGTSPGGGTAPGGGGTSPGGAR